MSIGGQMRYDLLATLHRPTQPDDMRAAARDLQRHGLTAGDIAAALRLSVEAVRSLLGEPPIASDAMCPQPEIRR